VARFPPFRQLEVRQHESWEQLQLELQVEASGRLLLNALFIITLVVVVDPARIVQLQCSTH